MIERYPALRLIVRYGTFGAPVLALLAGVLAFLLCATQSSAVAAVTAVVVFGVTWLVAKAFVEIVTILTEMLVPR